MMSFLQSRIELLSEEHKKAHARLQQLGEELEKAKANAHMILGHLNEARYALAEISKEQPACEASAPTQESEVKPEESSDGQAHCEEAQ